MNYGVILLKKNFKLVIEYDGTNYAGWQRQNNAITVQKILEEVLEKLTGRNINVIGCSRTDSGVHARGFICNFVTETTIPPSKIKYAINNLLPNDIVILDSSEVPINFHSRYNCIKKTYTYTILNREEPAAINRNYVYHFKRPLDIDLMKKGSEFLIGTHEFDSFRKIGSSVKTTTRTIYSIDIEKQEYYIKFNITGNGFLYNMVRIIVGTLLDVGVGKMTPESVKEILLAKDRSKAGMSLPAQGLCLEKIYY
ncbi:tRNA pseudouridine(38-40) synthase TruA [Clostridium homopropionicum]|uniref:tRNA pseudouridine(38-40) synthase TruA n=1 Tax=Clostridium homopropionicum TaxID=36844 RepID=UPI00068A900B|nr:tRNA pseudouridine(38-40) synthase TruA [Clostridium homopropionicum]